MRIKWGILKEWKVLLAIFAVIFALIVIAPKVADEFILSYALRHNFCFIISNDKFRDYLDQLPNIKWIKERRIPFMIMGDEVCLCPNISYERANLLSFDMEKISKKQSC